jgi:hypothetical protein
MVGGRGEVMMQRARKAPRVEKTPTLIAAKISQEASRKANMKSFLQWKMIMTSWTCAALWRPLLRLELFIEKVGPVKVRAGICQGRKVPK